MSADNQEYQKALKDTYLIDNIEVGFTKATGQTAGDLARKSVQQNNTIIQLVIELHEKLNNVKAELIVLKNKEAASTASTSIPDDLIKRLEDLSLGEKPKAPIKKGTLFAFKDPYVILEEEKTRLRK